MDEVQELLAEYGQLAKDDTDSSLGRARRLAELVAEVLRRTVPPAAVQVMNIGGDPQVSFDFEGRDYLISLAVGDMMGLTTYPYPLRDAGLGPADV
ncbi:hypothetical protein [Streptomyces sp. NPDC018711]|uniref:hypothetical protein n=1 Tax=Streptomyces sp. NPDC018711 TaxID=3365052 RepID=UPI0037A5C439